MKENQSTSETFMEYIDMSLHRPANEEEAEIFRHAVEGLDVKTLQDLFNKRENRFVTWGKEMQKLSPNTQSWITRHYSPKK